MATAVSLSTLVRFAELMPHERVPWPWFLELMLRHHLERGECEQLRDQAIGLGILRFTEREQVLKFEPLERSLDAGETPAIRDSMRAEVQSLVSDRLAQFHAERDRLFQEVLKGGHPEAQPNWYVAPMAEAKARAAELGTVDVIDNHDGSYGLRLKEDLLWEEDCLTAFIALEFHSDRPDSVFWALTTDSVPPADIVRNEDRISAQARTIDDLRRQRTMIGLLLHNKARYNASFGSWRGAWSVARGAVEVFQGLSETFPDDPEIAEFLKRAKERMWLYDD